MSFNYNHVTIVGRATKDPEKKITDEKTHTQLTLAVNRPYKNPDGTSPVDFLSVTMWGKSAELAAQFIKKGVPVLVDGRIQTRSFEVNGFKKTVTEIVGDKFEILATAQRGDAA